MKDQNGKGRPNRTCSTIRLLELEPSAHVDDHIVGHLITVPYAADTEYISLSALHGDPELTENITISDSKLEIPLNLAQAIRHIRSAFHPSRKSLDRLDIPTEAGRSSSSSTHSSPSRSPRLSAGPAWMKHALEGVRSALTCKEITFPFGKKSPTKHPPAPAKAPPTKLWLWVDYLCLRDIDPNTEGIQRSELGRIHKQAKLTVGWLGVKDEAGTTETAIDTIEFVSRAMPHNWGSAEDNQKHPENYAPYHEWFHGIAHFWAPTLPFVPPKEYGGLDDFERTQNKTATEQALVTGPWISVAMFLVCDYFTRSWILDEIAFAKSPVFLAQDRILNWKDLLRLTRLIEELRDTKSNVFPAHLRPLVHDFPLGIIWTLLREFERRQMDDNDVDRLSESSTCMDMSFTTQPRTKETTFTIKQVDY